MNTDDFLADLEAQLREARPRRDLRPALAIVPVVLVVAAIVAGLAGSGRGEREAGPAAPGDLVELRNGTGNPAVGEQAREVLEDAGYEVRLSTIPGGRPDSAIGNAPPGERQRIARLLGLTDPWTAYAPLGGDTTAIEVVLGKNELGGGTEPVVVLDASGRAAAVADARRRLEDAGLIIGGEGGPLPPRTTAVLGMGPADDGLIARVRRALGLPAGPPRYARRGLLDRWVGEGPQRVVVIVGTDYPPD